MFLELEDYKVLGVGDNPPAGFFTLLDNVFHILESLLSLHQISFVCGRKLNSSFSAV